MKPRPWSPAEDAALKAMIHAGRSDYAVAEALGRSRTACRQRRIKLGWVQQGQQPSVESGRRHQPSAALLAMRAENDRRTRAARARELNTEARA
jgi:hypothetical protein